ncbi:cysteine proteinase [Backusella circina FSU 941]|nr:cysteine proteinase [Backusella circina FSU 941]
MQAINKSELEANWSLISSDPDVFNDMLRAYNINQVMIQEAYSVTFDDLINDSPVYGVIYTSRYDPDEPLPVNMEEEETGAENIIFTSQIVTNACATLALLSILLNADIDRGNIIKDFASFTDEFSPINRGIALGNSPHIRKIHNSYAVGETKANAAIQANTQLTEDDLVDEDSFHFVSYIPKDGFIWELDGLKSRPVKLAPIKEDEHWLETLGPILGQKMSDDVQCNILVAIKNPLIEMKENLSNYTNELGSITTNQNEPEQMEEERENLKRKRATEDDEDDNKDNAKNDDDNNEQQDEPAPPKKLRKSSCTKDELQQNISTLARNIKEREAQTQKEILTMSRLKFDYFPFIMQLINNAHKDQINNPPPADPPIDEAESSKGAKTTPTASASTKSPKSARKARAKAKAKSKAKSEPELESKVRSKAKAKAKAKSKT